VSNRLPRAANTAAPASHPPAGLPGLDPAFSRLVSVPDHGGPARVDRTWHLLDNAEALEELGVEPVGTILCVHGNPTWSYLWRKLVTAATDAAAAGADAWRVIAVDQLEMGFSERSGVPRTLARRVRDLGDLTDALGLTGPVVTFGHDWGGVVSLGWAVDHPGVLAGSMLLNTAVHQPEEEPIPAPLRLALRRSILGGATVSTPAFLETTLALAHPPLAGAVKDAYRAPYRGAERRGGIGAFVVDIPVEPDHESRAELDRIATAVRSLGVPALFLWGPRDPVFSDRYLDDLAERMPHADVHRFEGAGHLIAEDVDYSAAALAWLGDRQLAVPAASVVESAPEVDSVDVEGTVPAADHVDARPAQTSLPLWHYLDELQSSDGTALVEMVPSRGAGPRVVTWRLLSRRVRQIAAGLVSVGVTKGDRISLLVQPGADLTAVLYACLRIGAVVVVADAGLGLRGLTRAVRGARPDHVIGALPGLTAARALGWPGQKISTVRLPPVAARALGVSWTLADLVARGSQEVLPEAPAPGDTAAVLFTSGSTGPAKGVVYTHEQLSAVRDALSAQYGVGSGTGLVAGFAPFALLGPALGARSVTPDMNVTSPKTLTAVAVAAAVAAVDATVVFLSPAALANVVATADALTPEDHRALAGVKTFLSAGAPVPEQLLAAASEVMPAAAAHTPYGMTEGLLMTDITLAGIREASTDAALDSHGSGGVCVGVPAPTAQVRISALDPSGQATGEPTDAPGVTGEIVVSAPHLKNHYDRLWLTNRAAVHNTANTDGSATGSDVGRAGNRWHRTGDVGHLDAAGRLWVEGRLPHVITTPAGVVTPVGPEQRIESVPGVARAAVVGVGPSGTQQLVAIVETTPRARRVTLAEPELAAAVRVAVRLPMAAVLVVPSLPTDIRHNSKINRTALSAWAAGLLSGGRMTRP
jgi:acyl-CoA synthetase (AMP-forming)/AMP-acid ligase II/pimeloyl-ACP methyl ester carboxylesterase